MFIRTKRTPCSGVRQCWYLKHTGSELSSDSGLVGGDWVSLLETHPLEDILADIAVDWVATRRKSRQR